MYVCTKRTVDAHGKVKTETYTLVPRQKRPVSDYLCLLAIILLSIGLCASAIGTRPHVSMHTPCPTPYKDISPTHARKTEPVRKVEPAARKVENPLRLEGKAILDDTHGKLETSRKLTDRK